MEHYITKIQIEQLRHLSDLTIELNPDRRTNLLLTGKNGSGKTSLLCALKNYLQSISDHMFDKLENTYPTFIKEAKAKLISAPNEKARYDAQSNYDFFSQKLKSYHSGIHIIFNNNDGLEGLYDSGNFLLAFYSADRKTSIAKTHVIEDVSLSKSYPIDSDPDSILLKYLVHLKTQQAYARNEGDLATVEILEQWFSRFENALKILLDNPDITLKYDYKNYNFHILEPGRNAYGFDQLSDGYSSAIQIISDLILRMEQNWLKTGTLSSYDIEGIVMIDELETHLHIGLQKKILTFLTEFFPRIQFVVSTHSPYILNSIKDCVIYDLEKQLRIEDMSGYSAEGIVEGYFELDSYSELLMQKIKRYQTLTEKINPTEEERAERAQIKTEMKQLPGSLAQEAKDAFEEIEQRRKTRDKV